METVVESKIKSIINERLSKKKKINESLASLEEQLFEANQKGNKRKSDSIKRIIQKLKKMTP